MARTGGSAELPARPGEGNFARGAAAYQLRGHQDWKNDVTTISSVKVIMITTVTQEMML